MRFIGLFTSLALAAALSAPALAAASADPIKLFQKVCLQHDGDLVGAEAVALALGLDVYEDRRGQPIAEGGMELALRSADRRLAVRLGPAPSEMLYDSGGKGMFCSVVQGDPDGRLMQAGRALGQALGLPPAFQDEPATYLVFYRKLTTGITALPEDVSVAQESILAGDFRTFDIRRRDGATMLSQTSAWKDPAN